MAFERMRDFVCEVEADTADGAITTVTEGFDVAEAGSVTTAPRIILTISNPPEPGQTDNIRRNLAEAYQLASSVRYGIPSATDAKGIWEVTSEGDMTPCPPDDALVGMPFCVIVDCGIPSWEVTTYRRIPQSKATAKFHLRFVVAADGTDIADFEKVSEAKAFAKGIMADPASGNLHGTPNEVTIRRKPVSDGGSDLAIGYCRQTRTTKTRPARVTEGATVKATHHWLVYGKVMSSK